jgi:Tfp pilus assembly protein PilO
MAKKNTITTGLKKRQAIDKANKTMFIWVSAAAVALSVLIVAAQFMYGQFEFNNKVLSKEQKTESTLKTNIANAAKLKDALAPLNVGDGVVSSEKILSALPVERNSSAFGAAIQNDVAPRSSVQIQSLSFSDSETIAGNPEVSATAPASSTDLTTVSTVGNSQPVQASMVVNGSYANITTFVGNLEKVIRPISVDSINLTGSGDSMTLNLQITTYYQPKKTVDVKTEVVK